MTLVSCLATIAALCLMDAVQTAYAQKALTLRGLLPGCFSASQIPDLSDKLVYPQHPVFEARNLLIAREGSPWSGCHVTRWPRTPKVGTVRAYEYAPQIEQLLKQRVLIRDESDSEITNLRKLAAGRIDATVVTVDEVKRMDFLQALAQTELSIKTVCDYGVQAAYVAFSRQHPQGLAAQQAFDEGFIRLQQNGTLARLKVAWRSHALERASAKRH